MMEENVMEEYYFLLRQRGVNNVTLHLELPYWKYNRCGLRSVYGCSVLSILAVTPTWFHVSVGLLHNTA